MAIVTLYDIDEDKLSQWAIENCPNFISWLIIENSEALMFIGDNVDWHIRYEFEFANEQEALLFQLRWQGQ
jgi:hypothetical protein